jgi:hypothetical protein
MIADSTVAFTNTKKRPDSYELTLSKKVVTVNSTIDTDEDFTFTLKLYDSAGNALTKEFDVTYGTLSEIANAKTPGQTTGTLDFTSGTATVTLKHGQTITIKGLPYKYGYEVSETPAGYTPTVEVDGVQKLNTQGTTTLNTLKATGICKDTTVAYTNTKIENIVPTGIRLDIMPYIIVVAMVLGLAVLLLTRRRSRR